MTGHTQKPTTHGYLTGTDHDREVPEIDFLSPLTIRGVTFRNQIAMSPTCQYVATNGFADDWHLVHLGARALGGAGLIFTEMTNVSAQARITYGCAGLYTDEQEAAWTRLVSIAARRSVSEPTCSIATSFTGVSPRRCKA